VITLLVFVPFAYFVLGEKMRLDYLWAFLCLVGAVYFVNRAKL
ncbi:MAG: DMT family protein, partial [Oscillospiraceae bacterium]|nr:DMT family protein [Oscillospiraceae bacterium]